MTALDVLRPVAERAERGYLRWRERAREPVEAPAEGRADFFLLGMLVGVTFVAEVLGHVQRARELDDRERRAQLVLVAAEVVPGQSDGYRPPWHDSAAVDEGQGDVEPEPEAG